MNKAVFCGLLTAAVVVALAFRLARLDARPMHHDEANQAVKFGTLLETGDYRYDRADHHGPSLYYFTLPSAWLRGQHTLAALDETTLRLVPALFGAGLLLLFGLLARDVGRTAATWSAFLAAVSPALTYYSRFYIQESLFAFFAFGFVIALGRFAQRPSRANTLGIGLLAGLAIATKETWLVVVPIALASCLLAWRSSHTRGDPGAGVVERRTAPAHLRRLLAATALAAAVVFLFYSSFLTDLSGLSAWAASFPIYGERGLGGGNHAHGWGYYLRLLAYSHAEGTTWTEALVLGLAAVGLAFAVRRTAGFWPRYLALYTLVTALAFSVLPYKTPWNLLPFYVGVLALAGCGAARLLEVAPSRPARLVVALVLVAASAQLASQAWRANFRYAADPRNPYVYAHTSPDLLRLAQRITDIAAARGDREPTLVKVVAGPYEQWPLPWYLRRMSLVGYWTSAAAAAPLAGSPVIVSSEENAPAVDAAVGDAYVTEFYGLRPGVLLTLYIERGAWEAFMAGRR